MERRTEVLAQGQMLLQAKTWEPEDISRRIFSSKGQTHSVPIKRKVPWWSPEPRANSTSRMLGLKYRIAPSDDPLTRTQTS